MVAILGAGIAGIAAGYHLSQRGIEHTIFEKNSSWGGLCDNFSIGEGFLFDKFVHLSFTKSEVVKDLFHKNTAFYSHKPESSNYYKNLWLKHPVQNNLAPLSIDEKIRIIEDFIAKPTLNTIQNYEDWLLVQFGTYFKEHFSEKYTYKYWTLPSKELSTDWLGSRISVPSLEVGHRKFSMTFRHFLPFNYLTEDIISSANTYFDTNFFICRSFEAFLDYALEYVNGIRSHNGKEVEDAIQKAERELKEYQQKHQKAQADKIKYQESLISIYDEALSLNLISTDNSFIREDANKLQYYIQQAIKEYDKLIKNDEDTNKLEKLKKQREKPKNKLSIYNSLFAEMKKQKKAGAKVQDSLRPISYIKKHIDEVISSPDTIELLNLLEKQLLQIKQSRTEAPKLPSDFNLRYEELKRELETCENDLKQLMDFRKTIMNPKWLNLAISLKYKLKELEKPKEDTYKQSIEQDKLSKIRDLEIDLKRMHLLPHDIKEVLNEHINKYFQSANGMVDSYPDSAMRYDDEDRRVSLLKNGEEFPVRNLGSKSNYMFLHLCFFLGLHRSIMIHQSKQVGSFLFVDQPSIPYYADKNTLDNDDKKQLLKAFRLLNDFMREIIDDKGGHFQMILIEHADKSYWEKLEYFHTVVEFSKSEKGGLIPKYIYE